MTEEGGLHFGNVVQTSLPVPGLGKNIELMQRGYNTVTKCHLTVPWYQIECVDMTYFGAQLESGTPRVIGNLSGIVNHTTTGSAPLDQIASFVMSPRDRCNSVICAEHGLRPGIDRCFLVNSIGPDAPSGTRCDFYASGLGSTCTPAVCQDGIWAPNTSTCSSTLVRLTAVVSTTVGIYGIQPSDFIGEVKNAFQRGVALAAGCHHELVQIRATESLSLERKLEQTSVNPLEEISDCYPDGGLGCKLREIRKLSLAFPSKMYIEGSGTAVDVTIARPYDSPYPPIDPEQIRSLVEQGLTQEAHKQKYGAIHNKFRQQASSFGVTAKVQGSSSRMIYRPIVTMAHAWNVDTLNRAVDVFCGIDDQKIENYATILLSPGTYIFDTAMVIQKTATRCKGPLKLENSAKGLRNTMLETDDVMMEDPIPPVFMPSKMYSGGILRLWGGMRASIGQITFQGGIYQGNHDVAKGGCLQLDTNSRVTLKETRFVQCSATSDGGAIFLGSFSHIYLYGVRFDSCISNHGKGGDLAAGRNTSVTIVNSTLHRSGAFVSGGGVSQESGNLTITRSEFNDLFTIYGPGAAVAAMGDIRMLKVDIFKTRAGVGGSATGMLTAEQLQSSAEQARGGAVFLGYASTLHIDQSKINDCRTPSYGGLIYVAQRCRVYVRGSIMQNGTAGKKGGGIALGQEGYLESTNTAWKDLEAKAEGGAIYMATPFHSVNILASTFTNNTASIGGVLNVQGFGFKNPVYIHNSEFVNNGATAGGGVMFATGVGKVHFVNCSETGCYSDGGASLMQIDAEELLVEETDFHMVSDKAIVWNSGNLWKPTDEKGEKTGKPSLFGADLTQRNRSNSSNASHEEFANGILDADADFGDGPGSDLLNPNSVFFCSPGFEIRRTVTAYGVTTMGCKPCGLIKIKATGMKRPSFSRYGGVIRGFNTTLSSVANSKAVRTCKLCPIGINCARNGVRGKPIDIILWVMEYYSTKGAGMPSFINRSNTTLTRRRRHSQHSYVDDRRALEAEWAEFRRPRREEDLARRVGTGNRVHAGDVAQTRCPNNFACNHGPLDLSTGLSTCTEGYTSEKYGCTLCDAPGGWGPGINDPFQCYRCSMVSEALAMALRVMLVAALWYVAKYTCRSGFSSKHGSLAAVFRIFLSTTVTFSPLTNIDWSFKRYVMIVITPISAGFVSQFHIDCVAGTKFASKMANRLLLVTSIPALIYLSFLSMAILAAWRGSPIAHIPGAHRYLPLVDHDPDNPERIKAPNAKLIWRWNLLWASGLSFYLVGPELFAQAITSTACYEQMVGEKRDGGWQRVRTYEQHTKCVASGVFDALPVLFIVIPLWVTWALRLTKSRAALRFYLDAKCVAKKSSRTAEQEEAEEEYEEEQAKEKLEEAGKGSMWDRQLEGMFISKMQLTKEDRDNHGEPSDLVRAHFYLSAFYTQGYEGRFWWWEMTVVLRKTAMLVVVGLYPSSSHQELQSSLLMCIIAASLIGQLYMKPYRNDYIGAKVEALETASLTVGLTGHTLGAYVTATLNTNEESVSIGMSKGDLSLADRASQLFMLVAGIYMLVFAKAVHSAIHWECFGGPPDPVDPDNKRHVQLRQFQRECYDEVSEESDDDEGDEARLEAYRIAHRPTLEGGEIFYEEEKAEIAFQKARWKPEMTASKNHPKTFLDSALGAECFHEIDIEMTEISVNPLSEYSLTEEAPTEVIELDREMKKERKEKKKDKKEKKEKKERSERKSDKKGDTVARARVERALEKAKSTKRGSRSDHEDKG